MKLKIELTEKELKKLVLEYINSVVNTSVEEKDIQILVKSKQNYKSEWEQAEFRAVYEK